MSKVYVLLHGFVCFFLAQFFLEGFEISPVTLELSPIGKKSRGEVELINQSPDQKAIQISIFDRLIGEDGSEEYDKEADDDFLVYPFQIILDGAEEEQEISQRVQVSYVGDPNVSVERAFRFVAEQVKIEEEDEEKDRNVQIEFLLKLVGSLYVTPVGALPDVRVVDAYLDKQDDKDELVLLIENDGTKRSYLDEHDLLLTTLGSNYDEVSLRITHDHPSSIAQNLVLAKSRRRIRIAWPEELPVTPVKAEFVTK